MYATQQDIIDRYTEDQLLIVATHPDSTDAIDAVRVERALEDASAEIDGYLDVRYALPLTAPYPSELIRRCCDIAMYLLPVDALQRTEEQERRYKLTLQWLEKVRSGDVKLNVPLAEGETAETEDAASITSEERLFTRTKMRGVL